MATVLRSIGYVLAASVAARLLGIVKSFWLARILAPEDFGALLFVFLLSAYAPIFGLGTVETLLKKVPFFNGKGDTASAREIERGTFTFVLLVALFFAGLTLPVDLALGAARGRYATPTRLMLLSLSFSAITAFFYHRLEAYNSFGRASAITTIRSASALPLQVVLTLVLGLNGAVLGYLLSEVVVCLFAVRLARRLPATLGVRVSLPLYGMLIRVGMPITIVWWTYILQTTVDRLFVMAGLGEAATGYYGIGISLAAAYLILPEAISRVLYPTLSEQYGKTGRPRDLHPLVVLPTRMMVMVLPLFTFLLLFLMPTAFSILVPQYLPGMPAAQVLVIGALFSGLMRNGASLLISVDRQGLLLGLVLGSLVLNIAGNLVALSLGLGITGIAASTLVSSACLTLAVWYSVWTVFGSPVRERIGFTLSMFAPALLFASICIGTGFLRATAGVPWETALAFALYAGSLVALPGCRKDLAGLPGLVRGGLAALSERKAA